MRYFIGNLIRGEAAEYFKATCNDLATRFGVEDVSAIVAPHITVKAPFERNELVMLDDVISMITEAPIIPLSLSKWNRFGTRTIFLDAVQPPVQPGQLPNNNPVLSVLRNGVAAGNQIVINEGEALTLVLQGSDPDNDVLRFDAMNMPAGSNFNTNVFSWTPSNTQNGAYSVVLRVVDLDSNGQLKGGSDSETIVISVNDNLPPKAKRTVNNLELGNIVVNGWQTVQRGDSFDINVFVENKGNVEQKDVQVTIDIPQLNDYQISREIDIKKGKREFVTFDVSIPQDFEDDTVYIVVTASNNRDKDSEVMGFLVE